LFNQHKFQILIIPKKMRQHVSFSITMLEGSINLYSPTLRDITPCSPLKVNRRFRGTRQLFFNELRFVISQKIVPFLTTAKLMSVCMTDPNKISHQSTVVWFQRKREISLFPKAPRPNVRPTQTPIRVGGSQARFSGLKLPEREVDQSFLRMRRPIFLPLPIRLHAVTLN
jgi:hypothetical protein